MARDKKASFKFGTVSAASGVLAVAPTSDGFGATITFSGTVDYAGSSSVFSTLNMVNAAAADFASQADTAASGATVLPGNNGRPSQLFVKVIHNNGGYTGTTAPANEGTPGWVVYGSSASDMSGAVAISPVVTISTTDSTTGTPDVINGDIVYVPVQSPLPYWQLRLVGKPSGGTASGVIVVKSAALVNAREGSL